MNKLTTLLLTTILLIFLPSFKEITNSNNSSLNVISFKDSILVFKSDSRELVEFDSNKNPLSNITENINYHIINFDTNEIILFFKLAKDNKWSSQSFKYYSTKEDRETIEFDTNSNLSLKVYLDINPYSSIIYSFKNGTILNFTDLKIIRNEDLDELGIYDWKDSFESIEYSRKIVVNEYIKDFEYSEYWRKESFKRAIDFLEKEMDQETPKCKILKRSTYNPAIVQYIGNQGMKVKLYAEYDCNQNYVNQSFFWVNVFYSGKGKWVLELEDQKLTH